MEGGRGCFRSFVARFVFIPPLPKLSTWPLDTRALAFLIPIWDSTYWSVYFEKSSRRSLFYSPIRCLHQGVFENSVLDLNSSEKGIIIGYFHLCEVLVLFTLGWIWLRWFIVCFFALLWISALVSPFLPLIEDNLDFSPSFLEINRIINCEFLYNSKTCSNKMRKFCLYIFYSNDRSLHSLGFEIEGTQWNEERL